jgi:hypothetical protein
MVSSDELLYMSLDEKNLITFDDIKNKKYTSIYIAKRDGKNWTKGSKLPALDQ